MPSLKTLALVTALLVALALGIHRLVWALASDETRIRWRIEAAAEAFGDGEVGEVMSLFARDYRDASSGHGRDEVYRALVHLFFNERHPETRAFLLRFELDGDALAIEVGGDGATARVAGRFLRQSLGGPGADEPWWEVALDADLVLEEGRWKILRTDGVDHGSRPGRR